MIFSAPLRRLLNAPHFVLQGIVTLTGGIFCGCKALLFLAPLLDGRQVGSAVHNGVEVVPRVLQRFDFRTVLGKLLYTYHMGIELMFIGYLLREHPDDAYKFMAEHTGLWYEKFFHKVAVNASSPLYKGLALVSSAVCGGLIAEKQLVDAGHAEAVNS